MGSLMPNAALFHAWQRSVAHGLCSSTELYSQKVYFRGLRLTSVKWGGKTVFCWVHKHQRGSRNPRHSQVIKINMRVLQTDHNISFILIMHHALALTPKTPPKSYVQLEDQGSGQAALTLMLTLYQWQGGQHQPKGREVLFSTASL